MSPGSFRSCETPGQLQGSKSPKPKISQKKTQNLPPEPRPQIPSKMTQKYSKKYCFREFLVFLEFFSRNLGLGSGGNFWAFFWGVSGFGLLDPCSWPGVSQFRSEKLEFDCFLLCEDSLLFCALGVRVSIWKKTRRAEGGDKVRGSVKPRFAAGLPSEYLSRMSWSSLQEPPKIATRAAIYRSLRTLRARNRKKVSKKVFLGVRRKVSKNTRKSLKIPKKVRKSVFLDFFGYFFRLLCGPLERPFLRLFCDFGPGGSGDFCKWRLGSQPEKILLFIVPQKCLPWSDLWVFHARRPLSESFCRGWCRRGRSEFNSLFCSFPRGWKLRGHRQQLPANVQKTLNLRGRFGYF